MASKGCIQNTGSIHQHFVSHHNLQTAPPTSAAIHMLIMDEAFLA